jgi:hypothetical protein
MIRSMSIALVSVVASLYVAVSGAPAAPPIQTITVVNEAGVSAATLGQVERAVQAQVSVAGRWWKIPHIRFGPGGWEVTLVRGAPTVCGPGAGGCHSATTSDDGSVVPWAVATTSQHFSGEAWATAFDHEVLEMLTNPDTSLFDAGWDEEICDVTSGWNYLSGGVWLSDFALPKAYAPDSRGMVDYMHEVSAREVRSGFAYDGAPLPIPIGPAVG